MARKPAEVTDTELAILDVLWQLGPIGIREIVEAVYHRHSPSLHATVKSLLERLAAKGYIECDRRRHAHRFAAQIDRETYVAGRLKELADSHFGGSAMPMLLALVDRVKLSGRDRAAIRGIIDNYR